MDDWKQRARQAQVNLKSARHGDREAALQDAAGDLDVNTVRRWVAAVSFLDRLEISAPDVRKSLETASFSEVEVLARWSLFDGEGALVAAQRVARGVYSARTLTAAMHKARREKGSAARSESYEAEYRASIQSAAGRVISDLLGGDLSVPEVLYKDSGDPPVDFRYVRIVADERPRTVAAIIVGPYRIANMYAKRRFEWLFRACALAWAYDDVVVLLPEAEVVDTYREWILGMRRRAVEAAARHVHGSQSAVHRLPNVHVVCPIPGRPAKKRSPKRAGPKKKM